MSETQSEEIQLAIKLRETMLEFNCDRIRECDICIFQIKDDKGRHRNCLYVFLNNSLKKRGFD